MEAKIFWRSWLDWNQWWSALPPARGRGQRWRPSRACQPVEKHKRPPRMRQGWLSEMSEMLMCVDGGTLKSPHRRLNSRPPGCTCHFIGPRTTGLRLWNIRTQLSFTAEHDSATASWIKPSDWKRHRSLTLKCGKPPSISWCAS